MDRGQESYKMRVVGRHAWGDIADELGYVTHKGALLAARRYAESQNLPWPVSRLTKGAGIYKLRRLGMSWHNIAKRYGQSTEFVWRCSYKFASRHGWEWPPNG